MVQVNIPEDIKARVHALTDSETQWYIDNTTAEQRATAVAAMDGFRNDPETKAAKMAQFKQWWTDADADQDGLLNKAEFLNYRKA